jgi:hypothetical protein
MPGAQCTRSLQGDAGSQPGRAAPCGMPRSPIVRHVSSRVGSLAGNRSVRALFRWTRPRGKGTIRYHRGQIGPRFFYYKWKAETQSAEAVTCCGHALKISSGATCRRLIV